ncbi:hypothetical protein [Ferrimicrobium acidiphilum]|uniref:hypothetical protein n=1 Tax=Ferrimicrobium acidiphilum TaxID=121039 RepID=UPI0023F1A9C7|nr:hypothetical protein [Ferrimicrobium acidiphilum]
MHFHGAGNVANVSGGADLTGVTGVTGVTTDIAAVCGGVKTIGGTAINDSKAVTLAMLNVVVGTGATKVFGVINDNARSKPVIAVSVSLSWYAFCIHTSTNGVKSALFNYLCQKNSH